MMSGPRAEIYKKVTLGGPRDVRPADNRTRFSMRGMGGEPQLGSLRGDRFLAHRGLIAVCCGTAMAEAGLLVLFAPAARGLAPQVTALPPLAIFHDLRWLYSTQRSWLWFAMLLDEVTSALDPELVAEVLDVIKELAASGMTMIIATHEMGFARDIARRVCFLEEGRIIEDAPPSELFASPQDERTRRFLRRIVDAGRL